MVLLSFAFYFSELEQEFEAVDHIKGNKGLRSDETTAIQKRIKRSYILLQWPGFKLYLITS